MDAVNRLAREMSNAIGEAITASREVEAVRERARDAGFDLKLSLDAVIGFAPYKRDKKDLLGCTALQKRHSREFNAKDVRFLHSIRIEAP